MEINFNKQDLEGLEKLIHSDAFAEFLLNNTYSFSVCVCVMQTLLDKCEEIKQVLDATNEGE